jgi:predicted RNase H-like nuclease (RuvC/YqgF family)
MRVRLWLKASIMLPALCLAGLPAFAQQQQSSSQQAGNDPVADAARKAREQKKDTPKPKKVFTDDDIKPAVPSSPDNTAGAGATPAAGDQKASDDTKKEDPNSETAWRKRFQAQRDKIDKAEKELDILQREEDKAQKEYYTDPQKALNEQNTRKEINEKAAKIAAKKQEISQLKQGLDDMEDQLRKSGGDPGWAR